MSLDEYEEKNFGRGNELIREKYLQILRDNTPKLEEEIIMKKTVETVSGGKRVGAGRKKREVTEEMIADLKKLNMEQYCEKHNCGEVYFLTLYYKNVAFQEEKIIEKTVEVDMFEGLLMDTHILYEKGYATWIKHITEQQQKTDWMQQDILHSIQKQEHTDEQIIEMYKQMKEIRVINAKYDDSHNFGHFNRAKIQDLLELQKTIKTSRELLRKRKYNVRILTDTFGTSF